MIIHSAFPVAKHYPRVRFGQRWANGFWLPLAQSVCTVASGPLITGLLIPAPSIVLRRVIAAYAAWKALG